MEGGRAGVEVDTALGPSRQEEQVREVEQSGGAWRGDLCFCKSFPTVYFPLYESDVVVTADLTDGAALEGAGGE